MVEESWRKKDTRYFFLGALFLLTGLLGILLGVAYAFGWPYYDPGALPVFGTLCTIVGIAPGILFVFLAVKAGRLEKDLVEFSAWVKTYRRISLADLARKLGKTPFESEKLLVQVVDRGLVKGFIDRQTDEFVLQEVVGQEQFIERCPRCNGNLQRRFFLGETVRCPYCQSVIVGEPPTARKIPSGAAKSTDPDERSEV